MNKAIEKVKKAAEGEDTAAIKQASDELDSASQAFSKVLYEKTEAAGGGASRSSRCGRRGGLGR